MTRNVSIQPLQTEAFKAYGVVLNLGDSATRMINAGTSQRLDLPGPLALYTEGGQPVLAVFRARAQAPEGPWHMLERHRLGSQTFVPLAGARCVALVALGCNSPDLSTLAAFAVEGNQGITLHPGTWHHPLLARDDGDFLVIERAGDVVDCDVVQLEIPVHLREA
jgi:ureidoglycolate lyase